MACAGGCPAPGCFKAPIASFSKCAIGMAIKGPSSESVSAMANVRGDPNRFVVAFCGSGTGHLTQAMKAVELLQARGLVLAGVATDTDASEKMLDEMVRPLGVPLLIIPAIELVDTEKGFIPLVNPPRFFTSLMRAQDFLQKNASDIQQFFSHANAGNIYNMYHLTLARFFQLNPLPPSILVTHMAAQFGLCALTFDDTRTFIEVGGKAVMDVMASIFTASGQTVPIGPQGGDGSLPPIIHLPTPLQPKTPRLILCYFLVQTNAKKLDELLAKQPLADCECAPNTLPRGLALAGPTAAEPCLVLGTAERSPHPPSMCPRQVPLLHREATRRPQVAAALAPEAARALPGDGH